MGNLDRWFLIFNRHTVTPQRTLDYFKQLSESWLYVEIGK